VLKARVSGTFAGSLRGIEFSRIEGRWLDGAVKGNAEASWTEGFAVAGFLAGSSLNPARIRPDWPGRINFEITGAVKRAGDPPMIAEVDGRLLSSTLRKRTLTGELRARLDEGGFRIARLELHGDGFDVSAEGRLRERLTVSADIRQVGGLLPGTEGSAKVEGWIRWRGGIPEGSLSADARKLRVSGIQVDSISLSGKHETNGGPFTIRAEGRGVSKGALRVDLFSLEAAGTLPGHTAHLLLRSGAGEAEVSARGGYRSGEWEGMVTALAVEEREIGAWTLAGPFRLAASSRKVTVSPFLLTGPRGGSAGASADLVPGPLRGTARAQWKKLDPAFANPWLTRARLSGTSSGFAEVRWPAAGRVALDVRADASGKLRLGEREFTVRGAQAELRWNPGGLAARWEADLGGRGTLRGTVSSAEPGRLGLPSRGEARAEWKGLDLSLLAVGFPDTRIAGSTAGTFAAAWREDGRLEITGDADLSGSLARGALELDVPRARAAVAGNEQGIRASLEVALGSGGTVTGAFVSDRPARTGIPEGGKVRLAFESVDLALASPWIPKGVRAEGAVSGSAEGEWLPGGSFALDGVAGVVSGRLRWRTKGGEVTASLRSADLRWNWKGESAGGEFALALEEHGNVRGNFRIPLPAKLPLAIRTDGEVEGALSAKVLEKGLLPAFFPGMIQETSGEIALSITVGGTWGSPAVKGNAALSRAGAYLPAAGIRLDGMELRADIGLPEIRVETIKVRSGAGTVEGSATVRIEKWRVSGYEAALKGKEFLTLDLPEVRLATSPDLSIEGTAGRLKVRGEIRVPELQLRGRQTPPPVARSEDVVVVDAKMPSGEAPPLALDVSVKVVLEKHALVKAQGIDARLEGDFTLLTGERGRMIARGEIRVAEGSYAVYGIRLKITRGSLLFAGAPVEQPTLDFLAIRTVGEVKAGVEVAGTLKRPVVKLFSEPTMQDTDILSYIVLGHPLGQQKEQAEPLMLAASALLPYGQSAMLQDRLKRRFGLDVIAVRAEKGETAGSVVTIGKYLNPRLFVSYGRSIFTATDEFTVRYEFRKRWQVESQFGEESGVDLFYKIEFR
jgi:translocation and assembly module TamB